MSGCGKCGKEGLACNENQKFLWTNFAFVGSAILALSPYVWNKIKGSFDFASKAVYNFCQTKIPSYYSYLNPSLPSFSDGVVIGAVGTAIATGFHCGQKYWEHMNAPTYLPFAASYEEAEQKGASTKSVKIYNNIVIGHRSQANVVEILKSSHIWMKGGLNYIKLDNEGANSLYFSLCSTKIFNNRVSVVEGFTNSDKIYFFCSQSPNIDKEKDIVIHNNVKYNEQIFTCVEVKGKDSLSPVCFSEAKDLSINNIEITTIEQVNSIFEL